MESNNFIINITTNEFVYHLYGKRTYYVRIRRKWSKGSILVFVKGTETDDTFTGYGIIEKTFDFEYLNPLEKKICIENDWYCKIVFDKLVKFCPKIRVIDTPIGSWNKKGVLLQGMQINESDILQIEILATAIIIS